MIVSCKDSLFQVPRYYGSSNNHGHGRDQSEDHSHSVFYTLAARSWEGPRMPHSLVLLSITSPFLMIYVPHTHL